MDALALYTRPAPPAGKPSNSNGTDGTLTPQILAAEPEIVIHPVLYVESCMRCLRMQLALLLRGPTWDAATASLLVGKTSIWPRPSAIDLLGRTLSGPVSKADIQSTIALAYSQLRSTSLRLEDRQQGLEAIIQIYDALHLSRRKAAIQRELAVMMSTDVTIERIQAAEMDLAGDVSAIAAEVTARSRKQMGAKEEVLDALESTYRIYGLPNATDEGKNIPSFLPPQSIRCLLETVFERFGWLEIQYALVREGARMSELLPGTSRCDEQEL